MSKVQIVRLGRSRSDIRKFVRSAWRFYLDDPTWVPPLIGEQVKQIRQGPYHRHGVIQPFMALRDGEPVGRVIAHYDRRHNEYFGEKRGCIGFFECIDDPDISRKLFRASQQWLSEQGMESMYGPLNFTFYEASGVLIDNFEDPPAIETVYNPLYYGKLFTDYGFAKAVDWYAYRFIREQEIPEKFLRLYKRSLRKSEEIVLRNVDKKNYREESRRMLEVFNCAWADNYGHIPFTYEEFIRFARELKPVIKPELLIMAEFRGKVVAFILSIPDANQAIRRANGRLFPFGLVRMLLGMRKIKSVRTMLLGILPEYRRKNLLAAMLVETIHRVKNLGYVASDCSLVLENNTAMCKVLKSLGAARYKTYRYYTLPIGKGTGYGVKALLSANIFFKSLRFSS